MTDTSAERVARNDAVFRDANNRIVQAADEVGFGAGELPVLCECADERCTEVVKVPLGEYSRVRSDPRRFINATGHDSAGGSHVTVVRDHGGWVEVEKIGEAGRIVEELDGRPILDEEKLAADG